MIFLYLYCKKENLLPLMTWIFLSSLGVFLTSNLGTRASFIKQSDTINIIRNIIKTNRFDLPNKCVQLNVLTTKTLKIVTFHAESIFMRLFQKVLTLELFSIKISAIYKRLHTVKTQYFSNKRAPPHEHT
ncbi:hypothetical protein MCU_00143 [Bartonella elizabethae Re6043vi]|uniref:Uncharacterized protein n=2 Tax=Bartonella elizabethae TaxID=807 RepID=J0R972_BAREL|nr:hypothetical protein [Bartonella elizabethae]EJF84565.1 hypothetical protein MCU_00143 [Bartonella elizabethae Re6043vi]EJF95231.1 hypothetical protein MEE_01273 [Bartonella elizabethae F9251 = ATCC 49927]VEJ41551.1 Uncharacterised protein [Bartonella elizabethae]